jgi:hypothetical protein
VGPLPLPMGLLMGTHLPFSHLLRMTILSVVACQTSLVVDLALPLLTASCRRWLAGSRAVRDRPLVPGLALGLDVVEQTSAAFLALKNTKKMFPQLQRATSDLRWFRVDGKPLRGPDPPGLRIRKPCRPLTARCTGLSVTLVTLLSATLSHNCL